MPRRSPVSRPAFSAVLLLAALQLGCAESTSAPGLSDGGGSASDGSTPGDDGGGCTYGGTLYAAGVTFPAGDGCNHCSCRAGNAACTLIGCLAKDAGTLDGGPAKDAGSCAPTPVGRLCVRGGNGSGSGEPLVAGDPLKLTVSPKGCFSSSCTSAEVASCSVTGSGAFAAQASFCLTNTAGPGMACTADCGGGGFASCQSTSMLAAGNYTVTLGSLSVSFSVPSVLPLGGKCDGAQF